MIERVGLGRVERRLLDREPAAAIQGVAKAGNDPGDVLVLLRRAEEGRAILAHDKGILDITVFCQFSFASKFVRHGRRLPSTTMVRFQRRKNRGLRRVMTRDVSRARFRPDYRHRAGRIVLSILAKAYQFHRRITACSGPGSRSAFPRLRPSSASCG
jgi:Mg-chelatase subunit ChlD